MLVLGERIKSTRISRKWTQEQLAKKVHATKQVISNWERGKANPDPKQIIALANAFDVSSDYLLGLSNLPRPDFRDLLDQLSVIPAVDNTVAKGMPLDLIKLLNLGIKLTIDGIEITPKDMNLISTIIELTVKRINEAKSEI